MVLARKDIEAFPPVKIPKAKSRYKHYSGVRNRMGRSLKINGLETMTPSEFDDNQIMKPRQFCQKGRGNIDIDMKQDLMNILD